MASANLTAVIDAYEALNRGDVDAALATAHPNAEFDWMDSNAPYAEHFTGRERARLRLHEFFAMWEDLHWTLEDVSEVEGGYVIAVSRITARGRAGIELDARSAWVWTMRDGQTLRVKLCQTKEDALATLAAERPAR